MYRAHYGERATLQQHHGIQRNKCEGLHLYYYASPFDLLHTELHTPEGTTHSMWQVHTHVICHSGVPMG